MGRESLRARVAREAAMLLYTRLAKEYKQAKESAAHAVGSRALPSNREVAHELDRLADELEGPARRHLIAQLRQEGLGVMRVLEPFKPRLVGSVWRGTARKGSDIDILVHCEDQRPVLMALQSRYKVLKAEWRSKVEGGEVRRYYHIHVYLPSGASAEVVVRSPGEEGEAYKCEIYGDVITGLSVEELEDVLVRDPFERFVPRQAAHRACVDQGA